MPRLGLCCAFVEQPIAFRTTTATAAARQSRAAALDKFAEIAAHNAAMLRDALRFCDANGIGCFRVTSSVLPLRTHPKLGYLPGLLSNGRELVRAFRECGTFAADRGLRVTFHPDQYVVLNSPDPAVTENSITELEHLAEVADWVQADVLTVHGGGGYGDKPAALARLLAMLKALPSQIRSRLAIENDDRVFSPAELLPVCEEARLPFAYDVHHHRCLPDGREVHATTAAAAATWGAREPLFHISSPIDGWSGRQPARHHDYIDHADFPACWRDLQATIEVEAKAKELAVLRLKTDLESATC